MRRHVVTALLLAAIVVTLALSWTWGAARQADAEEAFAGTDAQVTEMLDENGATPWFEPWFSPGSAELESGLFAAQAALGGTVLGYCIGRLHGRRTTAAVEPQTDDVRVVGP